MKVSINKLRKNAKGLSPIFAVLILIAIAVIAGIIVYMFTSGYLGTMMGGGTTGQEKVAIEAVQCTALDAVTAYAKSTGGGAVPITEAILKDAQGSVVNVDIGLTDILLADGTLEPVVCAFTAGSMTSGDLYTVTLISKLGNQFVSSTFKAP